jgi:hypothetical protein
MAIIHCETHNIGTEINAHAQATHTLIIDGAVIGIITTGTVFHI